MSLQSNHFPETLDTLEDTGRLGMADAVREAIELTLLRFGLCFTDAAAVATMTAGCCETNLLRVLSEPAAVCAADDDGFDPFA